MKANVAEATTLRALAYFYLIRTFRDVPFSKEPSIDDTQNYILPATPFDVVLDTLISDLERRCPDKKNKETEIKLVSDAITERVKNDVHFISAVGKDIADKARFKVMQYCAPKEENETGEGYSIDELIFFNRIELYIGKKKTDFAIDYEKLFYGETTLEEVGPYVVYQEEDKTYLMTMYRFYRMGATDGKTLKWDPQSDVLPEVWLEHIVFDILNEKDIKVYKPFCSRCAADDYLQ